ncbi:hypothetical protein [Candidatus Oscillochloris fontis]|uniref:golvesin C-terminal-like domain-containing protein n=1 Tax=Candidatus Oscillochloris fontis TaxID=2496868 RepID=UPI00101DA22C|nr:hypothetical protein [Candidatus Oscillochloris fontis]
MPKSYWISVPKIFTFLLLLFIATLLSSIVSVSAAQEVPTATEVICDNLDSCFSKYESYGAGSWGYVPADGIGSSGSYNNHAYWTYNSLNSAIDYGIWRPNLPQTGTYDVYIWYPHFPGIAPETNSAHYQVHDNGGDQNITWNQATNY